MVEKETVTTYKNMNVLVSLKDKLFYREITIEDIKTSEIDILIEILEQIKKDHPNMEIHTDAINYVAPQKIEVKKYKPVAWENIN